MLGSEDHHDSSIHFQDETEPLLNGHANGHSKKTETNQDEPQKNDNKPFLTRRQLLTLLSLGITSTLQNASFAILTPFFPVEVSHTSNKHIPDIVTIFVNFQSNSYRAVHYKPVVAGQFTCYFEQFNRAEIYLLGFLIHINYVKVLRCRKVD